MKNLKYAFFACMACLLWAAPSYAQDEEEEETEEESTNMIENGSFELADTEGMKKPQNFDAHIEGWTSATYVKADLFSEESRSSALSIPENDYGKQATIDGSNYAGFRAYTKDVKKQRTYIGRNLIKQMERNKTYCIKIRVSLADLSKYAVNSIGVYVSKNKMQKGDFKSIIKPDFHVRNKLNPVIDDREGWTTICGTYTANGGEGAIIIGCFDKDSNLQIDRLSKPEGFTENQNLDAYYYLENVEVDLVESAADCDCGDGEVKEEIIYSPPFMNFDELSKDEKIANSTVYFAQESSRISPVAARDLKKFAQFLLDNPSVKLKLTGHMDLNEFEASKTKSRLSDIGNRRAKSIISFFAGMGIDESRFTTQDKAASSPVSKYKTPMQLAKNRRVVFTIM